MPPSLAAVMAHPDDIEIHVGGMLWLLKDRGWDLHFVTACRGDVGSVQLGRVEIAAVRLEEARRAAAMIGATHDCLGVDDLRVAYSPEIKTGIVEALRRHRAEVVLTHAPRDYMADHELTSLLAREACFAAPAPNWPAPGGFPPLAAIPELYYADPTSQRDADGEIVAMPLVVDVESTIERKEELLACHASQREWLRSQHGEDDYLLSMREWARLRGARAGLRYGEGLRQHLGHPFPRRSSLRAALADYIHEEREGDS